MKAIPLSKDGGKTFVEATEDNAINGTYPLSRYLFVYVNKAPNKPLDPMQKEFLKMMLSKTGQTIVEKDGYIPLPAKIVEKQLEILNK